MQCNFFSDEDSDFENNPITFNEQWRSDQKIKAKISKAFGSNPQPSLEKIEFKVCSCFFPELPHSFCMLVERLNESDITTFRICSKSRNVRSSVNIV